MHNPDGSSTPHLLDFGRMAKTQKDMDNVSYDFCVVTIDFETDNPSLFKMYTANGIPKDKRNPHDYALHRAEEIYKLKREWDFSTN